MAVMNRVRRLVNPGRKRKLSPLQKLFFGSKRQRVAVAKSKIGKTHKSQGFISSVLKKRNAGKRSVRKSKKAMSTHGFSRKAVSSFGKQFKRFTKANKRKRNISSIVTVMPGLNPGKKRYSRRKKVNKGRKIVIVNSGAKMATKRRRHTAKRVIRRKRRNPVYRGKVGSKGARKYSTRTKGSYIYSSNPGRRRRKNPGMKRVHRRRRNPGFLSAGGGTVTKVLGVVGGLAVTKLLCGFVPAQFSTGIMGYLATGAIAVLQGKVIGKVSKNQTLGNDFMVGGLAFLAAKVLNDFLPSVGGYTGIGMIGPSSFYNPQVNQQGSMGSFVLPAATVGAIGAMTPPVNAGVKGLRRTGRLM